MIAASTHPWAIWHQQVPVEMERYRILSEAHQSLARRMVICGTHVHAGIEDEAAHRADEPGRRISCRISWRSAPPRHSGRATTPASRPFGRRSSATCRAPGLPETFESFADWSEMLRTARRDRTCDDPTKIWWDIRPSAKHPTLEMRICDMCTRFDDTVTIAALYQSILALLYHLRANNQSWRRYRRIFLAENKWRAQRYGHPRDPRRSRPADAGAARRSDRGADRVAQRARARARLPGACRARPRIVSDGTSADHQLRVYNAALQDGATSTRRRSGSSTG